MPELFHETGVRQAFGIVDRKVMGSITPPHPAEFLPTAIHGQFVNLGGFKGRGLVLRFAWEGPEEQVEEQPLRPRPGILYHITSQGVYWNSAIFPGPTQIRPRLLEVTARPSEPELDLWRDVVHPGIATPWQVGELNRRIGAGCDISVDGRAPRLRALVPPPAGRIAVLWRRLIERE